MIKDKDNKIVPLPDLDKRPVNKPKKKPKEDKNKEAALEFLGSILNEVASDEEGNDPRFSANLKSKDKRRTKILDRSKPDPHKTINLNEHRKK